MMRQNYIIFVLHVAQKNQKKKTGGEMSARDLYNLMVY